MGEQRPSDDRTMAAVAALVDALVAERLPAAVAAEVERRDLVPRPEWSLRQPSANQVMRAMLGAIEVAARKGAGTFVGGHKVALQAARDLGVDGAKGYPVLRRTRAQVLESPNPEQPPEGMSRQQTGPAPPTWPVQLTLPERRAAAKRNRELGIQTESVQAPEVG